MHTLRNFLVVALLGVICLSTSTARSDDPKPKANDAGPSVGDVQTQKLKGFTYFYGTMRVSLLTFPFKLVAMLPDLQKALDAAHARATGPMILMYHGPMDDATADYDIEIGFPVADKTQGGKDFKVREVPEYNCMSVLYTGALGGISSAFEKLVPAADEAPGGRTDEMRMMILYGEGAESSNNVLHVSVGVKP